MGGFFNDFLFWPIWAILRFFENRNRVLLIKRSRTLHQTLLLDQYDAYNSLKMYMAKFFKKFFFTPSGHEMVIFAASPELRTGTRCGPRHQAVNL